MVQQGRTWQGFREDWRYDAANLIDIYIGLPLWGAYTALVIATCFLIRWRGLKLGPPFYAVIFLWILCMINTGAILERGYEAFIVHGGSAREWYLGPDNDSVRAVLNSTYYLESLTADSLLIWRLWIIWSRSRRVVILPLCFWLAGMTTGGISVVLDIWNAFDRTLEIHHETLYNTLTDATFGFSLCVNISVTGLICGKLWWMGRQVVQLGARRSHGYTNVILILVESGALYAANQLAYLIAFMSRTTTATALMVNISPKIVALVPTLILLQISLGFVQPGDRITSANTDATTQMDTRISFAIPGGGASGSTSTGSSGSTQAGSCETRGRVRGTVGRPKPGPLTFFSDTVETLDALKTPDLAAGEKLDAWYPHKGDLECGLGDKRTRECGALMMTPS